MEFSESVEPTFVLGFLGGRGRRTACKVIATTRRIARLGALRNRGVVHLYACTELCRVPEFLLSTSLNCNGRLHVVIIIYTFIANLFTVKACRRVRTNIAGWNLYTKYEYMQWYYAVYYTPESAIVAPNYDFFEVIIKYYSDDQQINY